MNRKESKHGNRFYTLHDMAIIKRDVSIRNSMIKRGEVTVKGGNEFISVCGCGAEGCFIHSSRESEETPRYMTFHY